MPKRSYPIQPKLTNKLGLFKQVGYEPSDGQRAFHESKARFRLLCAGSRFGKSMAAGHEILWYLMTPGVHIWTCGPKYDQASKEFRYTVDAIRRLQGQGWPVPIKRLIDNVQAGQMRVEIDWSEGKNDPDMESWLVAKSWHEPDTLLGEELDLLVLSEGSLCPRSVWDRYLRARIGSRLGRVLIPTTPHGMDDFLYPTFYEPAMKGEKDYWMGQFGTWDNPHHPKEDIEHARRTMNELEFMEQYGGQFVAFTGRVYKDFSRATHVIEPFEIPRDWPRYRAIDYGFEDPFVCLWVASNEQGQLIIYREHYVRRWLLSENAERIHKLSVYPGTNPPQEEEYEYTVIDPGAKQHRMETGMSIANHLSELGLPTLMGNNDVEAGVFRTMEWFKTDPVSGKPGILIFSNCVNTIAELEKYSWSESKDNKNQGMKVQQKHDHAADALRYLVMTRPRRFIVHDQVHPRSFRTLREKIKGHGRNKGTIGAGPAPSVISW